MTEQMRQLFVMNGNYCKLNRVTLVQQELMPNPDNMFPRLAKARYFTKIDLTRGYWQIKLHPDCKHLTAFSSPLGQLQWRILAFGLVLAPSTFTKLMGHLTCGREEVITSLDDILLFQTNLTDHLLGNNKCTTESDSLDLGSDQQRHMLLIGSYLI